MSSWPCFQWLRACASWFYASTHQLIAYPHVNFAGRILNSDRYFRPTKSGLLDLVLLNIVVMFMEQVGLLTFTPSLAAVQTLQLVQHRINNFLAIALQPWRARSAWVTASLRPSFEISICHGLSPSPTFYEPLLNSKHHRPQLIAENPQGLPRCQTAILI